MSIRLLMIEDDLLRLSGLRAALASSDGDSIEIVDRVVPTIEDSAALFESIALHGADALRRNPVDGVLIDGFLPRERGAVYAEPAAVEIAIRITATYDAAQIADAVRPPLIFTTAAPDGCDTRAFIAYGGADVVPKTTIDPLELRRLITDIIVRGRRWTPPVPRDLGHGYSSGLGKYLRGLEAGSTNDEVASKINVSAASVGREKNRLRHALDLPERADSREIVAAAKARDVTWVPLRYEALARAYGVRPRIPLW